MSHHDRPVLYAVAIGAVLLLTGGAALAAVMPSSLRGAIRDDAATYAVPITDAGDTARGAGRSAAALGEAGPVAPVRGAQELGQLPPEVFSPEPAPVALRAAELNRWVDDVIAGRPSQEDPFATIDACVMRAMTETNTPAASIAIAVDGVITYTKGYGVKDRDKGGEVDADTLFRIGSTTKMMTAAAVMQLREQGAVDLDAPLTKYLPEFRLGHPWDAGDLNLHLLMSHQSGFPDQYFVSDLRMPLQTWVQTVGAISVPLLAAPGSFYNYANPNFSLAGAVIERLSGMSYNDYMADRVWDPAGMPLTTLDPTEVISNGNYATPYHGGQAQTPQTFDLIVMAPAGTAFSTPTEMVTWALLLQGDGDDVITAESKRLMQQRHVSQGYVPWLDYGYGVMITDWRDTSDPNQRVVVYDHGGNAIGGSSLLFWIPERDVVVSLLTNTIISLGGAGVCALDVLADIEPTPYDGAPVEPDVLDAPVGTYSMMDFQLAPWTANVRRVTDTLRLAFSDVPGSPLLMGDEIPLSHYWTDVFLATGRSPLLGGTASVDFTFLRDPAAPSRVRYMRYRYLVGQRVGQFPERVTIEGETCTPVAFRSELDMPVLGVTASGLFTPTRLVDVPLSADDPEDPASARIRHAFAVGDGGASLLYAVAATEPDDVVPLILLRDADGDDEFTYPDEVAAAATSVIGTSILNVATPLAPGDYQLWAWAQTVAGEGSLLDLDVTVAQGANLLLENVPRGLADGATWEMRVCAQDVDELDEPMTGMIQFSYDSPPRLFRIAVDWWPAQGGPSLALFLPLGLHTHELR